MLAMRFVETINIAIFTITLLVVSFTEKLAQMPLVVDDIEQVRAISLHPNGQVLAIAGEANSQQGFWVYDKTADSFDIIETDGLPLSITWSGDGNRIAGYVRGGEAAKFQIYDVNSKQLLLSFEQSPSPVSIWLNGDGTKVATINN